MEWLVNTREMKACDQNTIVEFGIPSAVLMERAALGVCDWLFSYESSHPGLFKRVLVLCGCGNNGGDGMAVARMLFVRGYSVEILLFGQSSKLSEDAKKQYAICKNYNIPFVDKMSGDDYTLIVDAIFGIGLTRNVEGEHAQAIIQANACSAYRLAIDMPSGISTDNGSVKGVAFQADTTITFAYRKLGQLLYPGANYVGQLILVDIGISEHSWMGKKPTVERIESMDVKDICVRRRDGHKGDFGKVLVVAGSAGMAGASIFSATAAYRSGCGLVRIYTTEENRQIVQQSIPEAMVTSYSGKRYHQGELIEAIQWADVIVAGPGLGIDENAQAILKTVLKNAAVPVVLDADALNIIAMDTNILLKPHTELVLTPHVGEMARLSGVSVSYIKENLITSAQEFANQYQVTVVLKDARTVIAAPYSKTYLNTNGNDGMATGGSGDVLSGIIGGLIGQGVTPEIAAAMGVYLHGEAGDRACKKRGRHGMIASDLLSELGNIEEEDYECI